jgi:hypothetical protein
VTRTDVRRIALAAAKAEARERGPSVRMAVEGPAAGKTYAEALADRLAADLAKHAEFSDPEPRDLAEAAILDAAKKAARKVGQKRGS